LDAISGRDLWRACDHFGDAVVDHAPLNEAAAECFPLTIRLGSNVERGSMTFLAIAPITLKL
jgi:hypothetical protein